MPVNIVPVTQLDQAGIIIDTPPVAIPPNAFTDAQNVRFRDGAVSKMEGEVNIFPNLFGTTDIIKYVAWWPSPNLAQLNTGYYLVIVEQDVTGVGIRDQAYFIRPGDTTLGTPKGTFDATGNWQHTFFQGGFALIINNTVDVPQYVLDPEGNLESADLPDFAELPGWDSYNVNQVALDAVFNEDTDSRVFDTGQLVDFDNNELRVTVADGDPVIFSADGTDRGITVSTDANTNTTIVTFTNTSLPNNQRVRVVIRSSTPVSVRAGVIRSFGDFLVAGNLSERSEADPNIIIRSLPGVVRSSDVAAPGAIPNNWNPFASGVSTADEFVITQDGIVQDMVELQSNLYIYSNSSISVMRLTGNAQVPLQVAPVTTSYGCLTTDGVIEYDGRHIVVGSQDIYVFGGHPGSIQSVSDMKVRHFFYNRLNPLEEDSVFLLRYQQRDEIWICYASVDSLGSARDEALIWNYRNNTWTRRTLPQVYSGDIGPVPGGGLPLATIHLDGTSGNNDQVGTPAVEVQDFTIADNTTVRTSGDGIRTEYDIDVLDTIPEFTAVGPALYDIVLPTDFFSGSMGSEIHMTFEGFTAPSTGGARIVFSFDVPLEAGLMGRGPMVVQSIRDSLTGNTDFTDNFEFVDVDQTQNPGEFVLRGTNTDAVTTILNFGSQRLVDRENLTRDEANDLVGQFARDPLSNNRFLVTFNVPMINQGRTHYFNLDPSTGARVFRLPNPRDYSDMYDPEDDDLMYGSGRGGTDERPETDTDQTMYRTRSGQPFTEIDYQNEPIIPTEGGIYDYVVEYPDATTELTSATLEAYQLPTLTDGTTDLLVPSSRSGVPSTGAPVLTFETQHLIWNGATSIPTDITDYNDGYIEDSTIATDTLLVTLSGDFTGTNRRQAIADHIRDAFHNQNMDNGLWTTRTTSSSPDDTDAEVISRLNGAYRLQLTGATGMGVTTEHFSVTRTVRGRWNWQPNAPSAAEIIAGQRQAVYPLFRFANTGSDMIRDDTFLPRPGADLIDIRLDASMMDLNQDQIANTIQTQLGMQRGWAVGTGGADNAARIQTATITNGLVPAFDPLGVLPTQDIPQSRPADEWTSAILDIGNTDVSPTIDDAVPNTATQVTEGQYLIMNTPTYLFLQIRNSEATQSTGVYENQELFIVEAPANSDEETIAEEWILRIRRANPRLNVRDAGVGGEFSIQPNNYGDLASFVLVPTLNNDEGLAHCQALLQASIYYDGTGDRIQLHPASATPFINVPFISLTDGYTQFRASNTQVNNISPVNPDSMLPGVSLIFDAIRSWPDNEVNFNFEVPLFAARQDIVDVDPMTNAQISRPINKILGAEIGWSTPAFSLDPRVETINGSVLTISGNDAPMSYPSYIERRSLGLTPEFGTEQVHSMALWADGSTIEAFEAPPSYNRLEIRTAGTNNPGELTDLTLDGPSSQALRKNTYFISEDYKIDIRTNGRFINIRITDDITDPASFTNNPPMDVDQEPYTDENDKSFRKDSLWRVSGIQLEVSMAGTR